LRINVLAVSAGRAVNKNAAKAKEYDARTAPSVADGLAKIERAVPNFTVIDLRLLDASSLDIVKSLEDHSPDARAIILTGYGDIPTAVAAARIGAVD
jgi:two-component system response regulator RegA